MTSLTIDPTRPPTYKHLIVITPDSRAFLVEGKDIISAHMQLQDLTFSQGLPMLPWMPIEPASNPRLDLRIHVEAKGYTCLKSGSLKRILRYLQKRNKEQKKHV